MMGRVAGVGLALVAGCSWSTSSTAHPTFAASHEASCNRTAPVVDTAIGAGLLGASLGGAGLAMVQSSNDSKVPVLTVTALLVGTGVAFLASSHHGYLDHDACNRELVGLGPDAKTPLHIEMALAPSCEQRRLDMYSRAITGVDQDQRTQLLAALPICQATANTERAWALTKLAAQAAGDNRCDEVEGLARQVYDLDIPLHDVVLLGDIQIKYCLSRRQL